MAVGYWRLPKYHKYTAVPLHYGILFHCIAYKDLHDRTETRQAAWEFPGWDECVVRTGEETMSFSPQVISLYTLVSLQSL